jgi:hypothetical protein
MTTVIAAPQKIGTYYGALAQFIEKYFSRRVELKTTDGRVMRGRVGWLAEDLGESDDELGFDFEDIDIGGERLPYGMSLADSEVESFIPLEGENTEEFIKAHF